MTLAAKKARPADALIEAATAGDVGGLRAALAEGRPTKLQIAAAFREAIISRERLAADYLLQSFPERLAKTANMVIQGRRRPPKRAATWGHGDALARSWRGAFNAPEDFDEWLLEAFPWSADDLGKLFARAKGAPRSDLPSRPGPPWPALEARLDAHAEALARTIPDHEALLRTGPYPGPRAVLLRLAEQGSGKFAWTSGAVEMAAVAALRVAGLLQVSGGCETRTGDPYSAIGQTEIQARASKIVLKANPFGPEKENDQ